MSRTGRPPGSGKWQKILLDRLHESAERGVPIIPLMPPGIPRRQQNQMMVAAKLLHKHGLVIKFRMWYPRLDVVSKVLRTYLAVPGATFEGEPVEQYIDAVGVDKVSVAGEAIWPGSVQSYRLAVTADEKLMPGRDQMTRRLYGDPDPLERSRGNSQSRKNIIRRDGYRCVQCGRDVLDIELEVDHIVPVQDGGTDRRGNLQTLCVQCRYIKTQQRGKGPLPSERKSSTIRSKQARKG